MKASKALHKDAFVGGGQRPVTLGSGEGRFLSLTGSQSVELTGSLRGSLQVPFPS